jgi:hypothetical protein
MSEIKLNLIDAQHILHGTIHGSIGDACVAALSAEPETIGELEAALARYMKCPTNFSLLQTFVSQPSSSDMLDLQPYDAGIVVIDLAARIVAIESTYSQPAARGELSYHNGEHATDELILYRLPADWLFLDSIEEYNYWCQLRRRQRASTPPFDARAILYGRPLLEFIAGEYLAMSLPQLESAQQPHMQKDPPGSDTSMTVSPAFDDNPLAKRISATHARWLMTPRDDLRGQSPRDVLLAKQDFIDFDLQTRSLQWSLQREGPPCLSTNSFAYRFAGFGTQEWVVYYDLVRHLLWSALDREPAMEEQGEGVIETRANSEIDEVIAGLEQLKTTWLNQPQEDLSGRVPAIIIDNERRRLPEAMLAHDMVIDDDCPICRMMADDTELGLEVGFWCLDGAHMDDDFAFSSFSTREEWEADRQEWKERHEEFDRKWEERQQCIARGEVPEPDPFFDPPDLDELLTSEAKPDSDHLVS